MAYFNRAEAYSGLEQYQNSIYDYTSVIKLEPDRPLVSLPPGGAYNGRGHAYYMLRQYQRAIQDYDKFIQLDPDMALAYNNQGMPTATQDHDKAI